jgi:hypothetical protein
MRKSILRGWLLFRDDKGDTIASSKIEVSRLGGVPARARAEKELRHEVAARPRVPFGNRPRDFGEGTHLRQGSLVDRSAGRRAGAGFERRVCLLRSDAARVFAGHLRHPAEGEQEHIENSKEWDELAALAAPDGQAAQLAPPVKRSTAELIDDDIPF